MSELLAPSAGYSLDLRVWLAASPGTLGRLTTAIGAAGADIEAIDLIEHAPGTVLRIVAVKCRDERHCREVADVVSRVDGVKLDEVWDRTLEVHRGGKLIVGPRVPLVTRDDLSMAYTPGVGRICELIAADPNRVWDFTIKSNAVAVVTDGTAVLGLGDIGPEAALPVMEGKALLFKEFAGIDAYPLCVRASTVEELISLVKGIAPGFGGINLEDIAAPACFEVEERLRGDLDIPVIHDDQHGTSVAVLAALLNAIRVLGRRMEHLRVVIVGMGPAGTACARLLLQAGVGDIIAVDRDGIVHPDRPDLDPYREAVVRQTNKSGVVGGLPDALRGADVLIGLSRSHAVRPEWLRAMRSDAVVFALANPVPEIMPEFVPDNVAIVATGRSDYPNQINNLLVFPGLFRGLLDGRARTVTDHAEVAAAEAIATLVHDSEIGPDFIVPSVFDRRIVPAVAEAVARAAAPDAPPHQMLALRRDRKGLPVPQ